MSSVSSVQFRHIADLIDAGRAEEARALLQRIVAKSPTDRNACVLMRHALRQLGQHEQALYYAEKALKHDVRSPDLLHLVAGSKFDLGRLDQAEAGFKAALEINPNHVPALVGMANLLGMSGRFLEAATLSRRALQLVPGDRSALGLYCSSLIHLGYADTAVTALKQAMLGDPTNLNLLSLLCSALNYAAEATPEDVVSAHKLFGRLVAKQLPRGQSTHMYEDVSARALKLGVISADFRDHPMMCYFEPLLEHHDRAALSVHLYHNSGVQDATTARLRGYKGVQWTDVSRLTPPQQSEVIRQDRLDVLLDLSGHTAGNALYTLHFKPAPVQATWVGYACTTGLDAVDFRIVDSTCDPAGFDALSVEQLWRLDPCFVCYRPPVPKGELPEVAPAPELGSGRITFGSYSSMPKYNDRVVKVWARVLAEVPGSVLLLRNKGLGHEQSRQELRQRFVREGVAGDRLIIEAPTGTAIDTLRDYARVDITLDTFPFQGMTTLLESMLMGVPSVLLAGKTSAGRQGVPLVNACGLDDLVAQDPDGYVSIAKELVRDRERRVKLRGELRQTLLSSVVCDEVAWTRRFETMLRQMVRGRTPGRG